MSRIVSQNVFQFHESETYECSVRYFNTGHNGLGIEVYNKTKNITRNLLFDYVEYFSGPLFWTNACFDLLSDEDCLAILRKMKRFERMNDSQILSFRPYKLYKVSHPSIPILIISANVAR